VNAARVYVDKKKTGEHSRIIDVGPWVPNNEQPDLEKARGKAEKALKKDEEINSVASINVSDPDSHTVI